MDQPPNPWSARDRSSFAYESTVKRWPTILTSVIDEVYRTSGDQARDVELCTEGKKLINSIGGLKHAISHNRAIEPVEDDGESNVHVYRKTLEALQAKGQADWFSAPWLYAECHMYRKLRTLFSQTKHWKDFDPFHTQKLSALKSSLPAVSAIAKSHLETVEKQSAGSEMEEMQATFLETLQAQLWGNATDLSLLTNLSHADIQALQAQGNLSKSHNILLNDSDKVWRCLQGLQGGRVSIVLDNAGFELYTDLIFADWLVSCTPFCAKVVFHPKTIPWFVSDVLPRDVDELLSTLSDPEFSSEEAGAVSSLNTLAERWRHHFDQGTFELSCPLDSPLGAPVPIDDFWTNPLPFHDLPASGSQTWQDLCRSDLVIFKVIDIDLPLGGLHLNVCATTGRKLTGDLKWDPTTSFEEAIGPLARELNILALRTLKADVVVGLPPGKAKELDTIDPRWKVNGKYAAISYCPKLDDRV